MLIIKSIQAGGAQAMSFGKSRAKMLMDNKVNKFEGVTTIKLRELINKFAFKKGDVVQIFDEMGKVFETISISQLEIYSWTFDEYMDHFVNKFWFEGNHLCVQIS